MNDDDDVVYGMRVTHPVEPVLLTVGFMREEIRRERIRQAAPDLLAACEAMVNVYDNENTKVGDFIYAIALGRAAIAWAHGTAKRMDSPLVPAADTRRSDGGM